MISGRIPRCVAGVCATLSACSFSAPLLGQEGGAGTSAAAESLFQEGKTLSEQGRYEEACAKFAASTTLERALGALLNLADCRERTGRTASAWAAYVEAASLADNEGDAVRARYARKRIDALLPSLAFVVLDVAPNPPGISVRLGDRDVLPGGWGVPIALDPGDYVVSAASPGFASWQSTVHVNAEGGTTRVVIPALHALSPAAAPAKPPHRLAESATHPPAAAWVIGGFGVLSLGVGGYFGAKTLSTKADADEHCASGYCDETGLQKDEDARRYAAISTAGVGVGLGLCAVATWLLWRGSDDKPATGTGSARLAPSPGGLLLRF